jgi:hypothetical protein
VKARDYPQRYVGKSSNRMHANAKKDAARHAREQSEDDD